MATLRKEIHIEAPPGTIWDAARDFGALHTRLVPGFVVDTRLEGDGKARVVTFGNGTVVREVMVSIDDERRRLAWTATGGRATHYNAVLELFADDPGTRVVWTIDLLPEEVADPVAAMQASGLAAMKRTFEPRA